MMSARRTASRWTALLALAGAVLLIVSPGSAYQAQAVGVRILLPIEIGLSRAAEGIGSFFGTIRQAGTLAAQNRRYQDDVDRLQAQVVQMRELELENDDLRRLLDLRGRASIGTLLSVNVVAQDPLSI